MKLNTVLLASAAVLFASNAMAADVTHPFYGPTKGKFVSETTLDYSRFNVKRQGNVWEETTLAETLSYGITDEVTLNLGLVNYFDDHGEYNNNKNLEYSLGLAYTTKVDNTWLRANATFTAYDPEDFYSENKDWRKYVELGLGAGYDMKDGYTPYVKVAMQREVDTTTDEDGDNVHNEYSARLGLHKAWTDWTADLAYVRNFTLGGVREDNNYAAAEVNYMINPDMAVGVYGAYLLSGEDSKSTNYDYVAGVSFRATF